MFNQVFLVGRLVNEFKIEKDSLDNEDVNITLATQRKYKNKDGEYETDLILCELSNNIAKNVFEYCKQGDLIGIKGSVKNENDTIKICAEKVTFLSSTKEQENSELER